MKIKGRAFPYFETGCGGTYWAVQDETYMLKGRWEHEGRNIIRPNDRIFVQYKDNQGDLFTILDTEIELIDTAKAERHKYFRQYIKEHATGLRQLNFAGMWVHKLPTNVDLGMWFQIFFGDQAHNYVTTLTPALEKTSSLKDVLKLFGV